MDGADVGQHRCRVARRRANPAARGLAQHTRGVREALRKGSASRSSRGAATAHRGANRPARSRFESRVAPRQASRPSERPHGVDQSRATALRTTPWHIVVQTSRRRVTVYRLGRAVRVFKAIVGKPSTPTPLGKFFVEESVQLRATPSGRRSPRLERTLRRFPGIRGRPRPDRSARTRQHRRRSRHRGFPRLHPPRQRGDALARRRPHRSWRAGDHHPLRKHPESDSPHRIRDG